MPPMLGRMLVDPNPCLFSQLAWQLAGHFAVQNPDMPVTRKSKSVGQISLSIARCVRLNVLVQIHLATLWILRNSY